MARLTITTSIYATVGPPTPGRSRCAALRCHSRTSLRTAYRRPLAARSPGLDAPGKRRSLRSRASSRSAPLQAGAQRPGAGPVEIAPWRPFGVASPRHRSHVPNCVTAGQICSNPACGAHTGRINTSGCTAKPFGTKPTCAPPRSAKFRYPRVDGGDRGPTNSRVPWGRPGLRSCGRRP